MIKPILLLIVVSAMFGTNAATFAEETPPPAKDRYVVLVSVDGLAASYLTDTRAKLPTLRKLAKAGASAAGMLTSFPSVTWPAHTSLITGTHPAKHGVIGNGVWNRQRQRAATYIGDPEFTKEEAIQVPTLYDVAHDAGYRCASVIWPCSNGAKSLQWVIPDSNQPELLAQYTTPGFASELSMAGIDLSKLGEWGWKKEHSTERDLLYARVARYLLEQQRVNLLLLHLITPDGVEHNYGPHTPEAYQAVAESDERLAEIWDTLQRAPFAGKSTLFVVSDHGFAPYDKLIRPNVVLKELDLLATDADGKVTHRTAWCVAQGGSAFLYILDESRVAELIPALKAKFAAIEGVDAVLTPSEFKKLGLPGPDTNAEAPDLVLTTGPGFSFNDALSGEAVGTVGGPKGTHGHDPRPDYMHATFVAAGAGIKEGVHLEQVRNVDVAPTIAHLLGITLKNVDGQVLREILTASD